MSLKHNKNPLTVMDLFRLKPSTHAGLHSRPLSRGESVRISKSVGYG